MLSGNYMPNSFIGNHQIVQSIIFYKTERANNVQYLEYTAHSVDHRRYFNVQKRKDKYTE